jgi:transcriptional regulator with XRE-family HTH domain
MLAKLPTRRPGQRPGSREVDKTVGDNLKRCRLMRNLSQSDMADKIGVSYQAVQKYEAGRNRASVAVLLMMAEALKVPMQEFLKGTEKHHSVKPLPDFFGGMDKNDVELWHIYRAIHCQKQRQALLNLARTMAKAED